MPPKFEVLTTQKQGLVPWAAIHRLARRIAQRFRPELIILFGSYAYGQPRPDSDVDLLVVLPTEDEGKLADRIRWWLNPRFRLDLHVRALQTLRSRLKEGDWFLCELVVKGKVLYGSLPSWTRWARIWFDRGHALVSGQDGRVKFGGPMKKSTAEWIHKADHDLSAAQVLAAANPPLHDEACFHCQQAVEKYFKALLQQWGLPVPRTHELNALLDLLVPHDAGLEKLRRGLKSLTTYAVTIRYPETFATPGKCRFALRLAGRVRQEVQQRLRPRKRRRKSP
jgi:HEPN domain-containing protein/predicted nucleotidyltransferase